MAKKPIDNGKLRKRLLAFILLPLLLLLSVHVYFTFFGQHFLDGVLRKILAKENKNLNISFEDIQYTYYKGLLEVRGFQMDLAKAESDSTQTKLSFELLSIKGVSFWQIISNQEIKVLELEIVKPFLSHNQPENSKHQATGFIINKLKDLEVKRLYIRDASVFLQTEHFSDSVRHIDFSLDPLFADSLFSDDLIPYLLKNAQIRLGANEIQVPGGQLAFASLRLFPEGNIDAKKLNFQANDSLANFQSMKHTDLMLKDIYREKNGAFYFRLQADGAEISLLQDFMIKKKAQKSHFPKNLFPLEVDINHLNIILLNQQHHETNRIEDIDLSFSGNSSDSAFWFPEKINLRLGPQVVHNLFDVDASFNALTYSSKEGDLELKDFSATYQKKQAFSGERLAIHALFFKDLLREKSFNPDVLELDGASISLSLDDVSQKHQKGRWNNFTIKQVRINKTEISLASASYKSDIKNLSVKIEDFNSASISENLSKLSVRDFACGEISIRGDITIKAKQASLDENKQFHLFHPRFSFQEGANIFDVSSDHITIAWPDFEKEPTQYMKCKSVKLGDLSLVIKPAAAKQKASGKQRLSFQFDEVDFDYLRLKDGSEEKQFTVFCVHPFIKNLEIHGGDIHLGTFKTDSIGFSAYKFEHGIGLSSLSFSGQSKKAIIHDLSVFPIGTDQPLDIKADFKKLLLDGVNLGLLKTKKLPKQILFAHGQMKVKSRKSGNKQKSKFKMQEFLDRFQDSRFILEDINTEIAWINDSAEELSVRFLLDKAGTSKSLKEPFPFLQLSALNFEGGNTPVFARLDTLEICLNRRILLSKNISFQRKNPSNNAKTIDFKAVEIFCEGFSWNDKKGFIGKFLDFEGFSLDLLLHKAKQKHSSFLMPDYLRNFKPILRMEDAHFALLDHDSSMIWLNDFSCELDNPASFVNKELIQDQIHKIEFEEAGLHTKSRMALNFYGGVFSGENQLFVLDSLQLKPLVNKELWGEMNGFQSDWTSLKTDRITAKGIDASLNQSAFQLCVNSIDIRSFILDDYRDKRLPMPKNHFPKLPADLIHSLPFQLCVDSLITPNAFIQYTEHESFAPEPGTVFFDSMDILLRNICNIKQQQGNNPDLSVSASGRLMGQARADIEVSLSLTDTAQPFRMECRLGTMQLDHMNKSLENLAFLSIRSGELQQMKCSAQGNAMKAWGEMEFLYNDLKIRVIDRKTLKMNFGDALLGFFANTFVVKKSNPTLLLVRKGPVFYERNTTKSVFNYWVKLVLSGIKTSIGFERRKIEKKVEQFSQD